MNRVHRLLAIGCSQPAASPIHGRWAVDLDATLANATSAGARGKGLDHVRETYAGGTLQIDAESIVLGLQGDSQTMTTKYTAGPAKGDCIPVTWATNPRTLQYCVRNDRLEISDPATPLVLVFKRS